MDKEKQEIYGFIRSLAPMVIDGFPSSSPYPDLENKEEIFNNAEFHIYKRFFPEITNQGEPPQKFNTAIGAVLALKKSLSEYVGDSKRVIIRKWPEIRYVDNFTGEKPYWTIYCRLLADNGIKKLRPLEKAPDYER